jgi:Enoyl-(Acyl carrier protein) reductase
VGKIKAKRNMGLVCIAMSKLGGKNGLIVGIANEHSLAYGCARHMRMAGAELAITYLNAKAEHYVRPLADLLESKIVLPCDVTRQGKIEAVFEEIEQRGGASILSCIRLLMRKSRICMDVLSIARRKGSPLRRRFPYTRSSEWLSLLSHL